MKIACSSRMWIFCALAVASMLSAAVTASAQEYPIKLNRPAKVGDTYAISAKGNSAGTQNINVPGVPPKKQDEKADITFEGTVKVLAVSSIGKVLKSEYTVSKCTINGKSPYNAGDVILADNAEGKKALTVKGEAVSEENSKALLILIEMPNADDKTDDDQAFGTVKPQKVGDSWPVNAAVVADGMTKEGGLAMKAEDVQGTVTLVSAKEIGGKTVLSVALDVTLKNLGLPLPPSATVDSSAMKIHMSMQLPADPAGQPISQTKAVEMKFQATMPGPTGQKGPIEVSMQESAEKSLGEAKP